MEDKNTIVLLESKFQKIYIDTTLDIYIQVWYSTTEDMSDDEYKNEFTTLIENVDPDSVPIKKLIDLTDFEYVMSPDMQEWHNENVFKNLIDKYVDGVARLFFFIEIFAKITDGERDSDLGLFVIGTLLVGLLYKPFETQI